MFSPFLLLAVAGLLNAPYFLLVICLVISIASTHLIYLALIRHTRRRVLQSLIRKKACREPSPFVLISRSYGQSKDFVTFTTFYNQYSWMSMFESLIYDLSHKHPLVVLGDKDLDPDDPAGRAIYVSAWPDSSGADQRTRLVFNVRSNRIFLTSEIKWEDVFLDLAKVARVVLLIPALSEGVRREISLLRDNALGIRTIVYMWPRKGSHPYEAISASAEAWEEVRKSLEGYGLALPAHRPGGALILLNHDFSIRSILEPIPRRNILSPLPPHEGSQAPPLKDVVNLIHDYEIAANPDRYGPMWGTGPH